MPRGLAHKGVAVKWRLDWATWRCKAGEGYIVMPYLQPNPKLKREIEWLKKTSIIALRAKRLFIKKKKTIVYCAE